jgi:hypothetical protein
MARAWRIVLIGCGGGENLQLREGGLGFAVVKIC